MPRLIPSSLEDLVVVDLDAEAMEDMAVRVVLVADVALDLDDKMNRKMGT
jgi:hypothetical protein